MKPVQTQLDVETRPHDELLVQELQVLNARRKEERMSGDQFHSERKGLLRQSVDRMEKRFWK